MISATACLERMNDINYTYWQSREIIRRNSPNKRTEIPDFFRFVSGAEFLANGAKGNFPVSVGDCAIYLVNYHEQALAVASANIDPDKSSINVIQLQGANFRYLQGRDREMVSSSPWDLCFLDIIEEKARVCRAHQVSVISARSLEDVRAGRLDRKKMVLRYDVSAIQKGFFLDEESLLYIKPLS